MFNLLFYKLIFHPVATVDEIKFWLNGCLNLISSGSGWFAKYDKDWW